MGAGKWNQEEEEEEDEDEKEEEVSPLWQGSKREEAGITVTGHPR
jgi:hypothetical protein